MTTDIEAGPLDADRSAAAVQVLARAFWDDPFVEWVFPDERKRERQLTWLFELGIRYGLRHGHVDSTHDTDGAAVWLPPGETTITLGRLARLGFLKAPILYGIGPFSRFLKAMNHLEPLHHHGAPGAHWYLFILGVDPPKQGQGFGGRLMSPKLAQADASGLPCYLETMKENNLPFYRRHGFEVAAEGTLPAAGRITGR